MLSRVLAIVVTVLSIAFLGFAGVVTLGGPNWQSIARSMKDYQFSKQPGPEGQWSATSVDGQSVGSSKVLPSVIVSALKDENQKLQDQLNELESREPQVTENLRQLENQISEDRVALDASLEVEKERLARQQAEIAQLSNQIVQKTDQGTAVEAVVSDRRSDIFRLLNQLEVLRADEAQLEQIHRQMSDLIEQVDGDLIKARRREQQLRSRLGE